MNSPVPNSDPNLNSAAEPDGWRAGGLELDLTLRRASLAGERLALQEIPFAILLQLLERGGRPLSRQELHAEFWSRYDNESFERSLNTAMRKLRRALGDDARAPRLIETLRASGYRWIGPAPEPLTEDVSPPLPVPASGSQAMPAPGLRRLRLAVGAGLTMLLATAGLGWWMRPASIGVTVELPAAAVALNRTLAAELAPLALPPVRIEDDAALAGEAVVRTGSVTARVPLRDNPDTPQELLVRIALAAPPAPPAATALPAKLQHDLVDGASALAAPALNLASARRAAAEVAEVTTGAPQDSGAWLTLARAQLALAQLGEPPAPHIAASRLALHHALEDDPRSVPAMLALAKLLYWHAWDDTAADRWLALAAAAAPRDGQMLDTRAWIELAQGKGVAALADIARAAAADPMNPGLQSEWGWFDNRTGDFQSAVLQCRHAAALPHADPGAAECVFEASYQLRRYADAWAALRAAPPTWLPPAALIRLDQMPPRQACVQALRLAAEWLRTRPSSRFLAASEEAAAGDLPAARRDLDAALSAHEPAARLLGATPELASLGATAAAAVTVVPEAPPAD